MNQYIITEEQLSDLVIFSGQYGQFEAGMSLGKLVRSHPYNPQAEREIPLISFDAIMGIHHELTNINNIASHIGDLLTPLNQCLDAHNQRIQQAEREKVLDEFMNKTVSSRFMLDDELVVRMSDIRVIREELRQEGKDGE